MVIASLSEHDIQILEKFIGSSLNYFISQKIDSGHVKCFRKEKFISINM